MKIVQRSGKDINEKLRLYSRIGRILPIAKRKVNDSLADKVGWWQRFFSSQVSSVRSAWR